MRQVRLVRGLQAVEAWEEGAATMEVELSHDNVEGSWTRDGVRLQPGPTCQLDVQGPTHTLALSGLRPQDSGLIAFKAEGVHTSARLTVTGAWAWAAPLPGAPASVPEEAWAGWWFIPGTACATPRVSGPASHLPLLAHLELPVKFSRPLQDVVATEKDRVTLECELSRPNVDVRWLKVAPAAPPLTVGWQGWGWSAGASQCLTRPRPSSGRRGAASGQDSGHGGPGCLPESHHFPLRVW